jgi:hypothetical protein
MWLNKYYPTYKRFNVRTGLKGTSIHHLQLVGGFTRYVILSKFKGTCKKPKDWSGPYGTGFGPRPARSRVPSAISYAGR